MPTISRRGLLLGGFPRFAPAQDTITVEEFRALSARLAGASPTDLNASAGDNWLTTGGSLQDDRYSTLADINDANVGGITPSTRRS